MVSSTPRPHFTPGKDPVPILQDGGWAPGPVWTYGKSRPQRDSIPDRPARSSVAIPTELPGPQYQYTVHSKKKQNTEEVAKYRFVAPVARLTKATTKALDILTPGQMLNAKKGLLPTYYDTFSLVQQADGNSTDSTM